jgi:protein-S-isoprenylcysteine O-methyltransferase
VPPSCLQSWRFFSRRIAYEEATLVRFFGQAYLDYAARTPTWIPGIR